MKVGRYIYEVEFSYGAYGGNTDKYVFSSKKYAREYADKKSSGGENCNWRITRKILKK